MICTLDGKLLAITDPLPGARHDAHAFHDHGLDQLLDSSTLADMGYVVGLGLATPTKRRPGLGLLRVQRTNNRVLNRLWSVVERGKSSGKDLADSSYRVQAPVGFVWVGVFFWCGGWCSWLRGTPYE